MNSKIKHDRRPPWQIPSAIWRRDRRGVAAVEFVFLAPLLITLYFGTMEISHALQANKKIGRAAASIGDIVTQESALTAASLDAILKIGAAQMQPLHPHGAEIHHCRREHRCCRRVAKVAWSRKLDGNTVSTAVCGQIPFSHSRPTSKFRVPLWCP